MSYGSTEGHPTKPKYLQYMVCINSNIFVDLLLLLIEYYYFQDKKPMPGEKPKLHGDKQRPSSKRKYLEDSDDSDTGNNTPPPKKPLRQKKGRFDSPVVDLSDVESSPAKSESTIDRLSSLKQKISLKSDSCSVHLSPQSDLSDVESTPETSELVADRLSSLKQKVSHTLYM